MEAARILLTETQKQIENAKAELAKPFTFEDELKAKSKQLHELNIELNLDKKDNAVLDTEPEEATRKPSDKANRER